MMRWAGAHHVDDGGVVVNLLQDGLYSLEFREIAATGLVFHTLQFIIQREFLVMMIESQAAAILQRCADCLKQGGQLLNGGHGREVVLGRSVSLAVFISQLLGASEGQLLVAGIDLAGEIMRLGGELEDAGASGVGKNKVSVKA